MAFQKKCLKKMEEISNSGATIIFVNHGVVVTSSVNILYFFINSIIMLLNF